MRNEFVGWTAERCDEKRGKNLEAGITPMLPYFLPFLFFGVPEICTVVASCIIEEIFQRSQKDGKCSQTHPEFPLKHASNLQIPDSVDSLTHSYCTVRYCTVEPIFEVKADSADCS